MTSPHVASVSVSFAEVSVEDPSREQIIAWVSNALADFRPAAGLDLKVVDESEIRQINARFRGQDRPTNVLSFPAELPAGVDLEHLGDIVIAAPILAREAQEYGIPLAHRWAHMITHGVLHLLGFDHQSDTDAERMQSEEIRILARLGIPDPYA